MLTLKRAVVKDTKKKRPDYIEAVIDIDGVDQKAICYPSITGDVNPGDDVVVNTTAVDLGLGTGGFHFVVLNLNNRTVAAKGEGHIMKLRYTPMQLKCLAAEEEESAYHEALRDVSSIDGMPVIIGTLHSQLPAAAVTLKKLLPEISVAYIMTDGAALPIAFSNLVAQLKATGIVDSTITVGHAFGGDFEAVNIFSGLAVAKYAAGADVAIVCMGPGIVGTGTKLGFTGIEQGQIINAVNSLHGKPIAIPRLSFADKRKRHVGISHHTITALTVSAMSSATVTLPLMDKEKQNLVFGQIKGAGIDSLHEVVDIDAAITLDSLREKGILPTTMGRTIDDEPEFFMAAGAAAVYAARDLRLRFV